jgi:8-oxo-dGTP pyrophosphatase MutT (NUDIX family)
MSDQTLITDFEIINAAGGIVFNEKNEILMIYRLDHWDFPKGKVESHEKTETAAIREVMEETGISNLKIVKKLPTTYHTYILDHSEILKETRWFEMETSSKETITPQKTEGITEVVWVKKEEVTEKLKESYTTLKELWSKYLKLK